MTTDNLTSPYTYADWIQMKPGAIIGGFRCASGNKQELAPVWALPDWMNYALFISKFVRLERDVQWRKTCEWKTVNQSKVANAQLQAGCTFKDMKFDVTAPVGIYLGYIVRVGNVSYVNVLAGEGVDVWIPT